MKKDQIITILVIVVLALGAYIYFTRAPSSPASVDTARATAGNSSTKTTQSVSTEPSEATVIAKANAPAHVLGITIAPTEVVEDSRCPTEENIKCIQAGTVRVRTNVTNASGEKTMVFTLGAVISLGGETIELISVLPAARAAVPILLNEYRFSFRVVKVVQKGYTRF
ncbi:MAG: hypothetical protein ACYC8S_02280 [Minisyncoccota bacterium]